MSTNYIIGIIIAIVVIGGGVFFLTSKSPQNPPQPSQTNTENNVPTTPASTPTNSASSDYKVVGGTSKTYKSPNGDYVAVSASDEQGNSAISITDSTGKALTPSYCGFYDSWSSDNTKIKVLLPPECGYSTKNMYYYLTVNGVREPIEGSSFVPTAQ